MLHLGHVESYHLVREVLVSVLPGRHRSNAILVGVYDACMATGNQNALDEPESYWLRPELLLADLRSCWISRWADPLRQTRRISKKTPSVTIHPIYRT